MEYNQSPVFAGNIKQLNIQTKVTKPLNKCSLMMMLGDMAVGFRRQPALLLVLLLNRSTGPSHKTLTLTNGEKRERTTIKGDTKVMTATDILRSRPRRDREDIGQGVKYSFRVGWKNLSWFGYLQSLGHLQRTSPCGGPLDGWPLELTLAVIHSIFKDLFFFLLPPPPFSFSFMASQPW